MRNRPMRRLLYAFLTWLGVLIVLASVLSGCARPPAYPSYLCRVAMTPTGETVLVCTPLPDPKETT